MFNGNLIFYFLVRRPYDSFPPIFTLGALSCVRKRRLLFLKKDQILSVIWSVICPRNLPWNLPSEFATKKWSRKCPSNPTSTCAGGQDDVSSQVNSFKFITKSNLCLQIIPALTPNIMFLLCSFGVQAQVSFMNLYERRQTQGKGTRELLHLGLVGSSHKATYMGAEFFSSLCRQAVF